MTTADAERQTSRQPRGAARAFRTLIGLVYLFGAPTHLYFALVNPAGYRDMGAWAPPITPLSREFWDAWFIPNARFFGVTLAFAELAIALLILSRGRATALGFIAATGFHLALAALFGMWPYTVPTALLLAYMTTLEFDDGLATRLISRYSSDKEKGRR